MNLVSDKQYDTLWDLRKHFRKGVSINEVHLNTASALIARGLAKIDGGKLFITPSGKAVSDAPGGPDYFRTRVFLKEERL